MKKIKEFADKYPLFIGIAFGYIVLTSLYLILF